MGQNPPNKGNKQPERTPQEDAQIRGILTQYRQLAKSLNTSRTEVSDVLAPILELPDTKQIELLKALAKENTTPAADIVLAMNTYAPQKEVRKEARRALIRLEGTDTYPEWEPPVVLSLSDALGTSAFDEAEDDEDDMLDGENVVEHFLNYWAEGEFEDAYDLLSTDSPIRAGLTRDAWVAQRQAWATKAEPAFARIDVGYGLEADVEDLTDDLDDGTESLDAFWSFEMKDVPGNSIPELPTATIVYDGTGRRWFWSEYTFLEEEGELRVQSMRDKGAESLQLSIEEVEEQLEEVAAAISAMAEELAEDDDIVEEEGNNVEEDDALEIDIEEVAWFSKQSLHYCDALIARRPDDVDTYKLASQQATIIHDLERAAAYVALAAERFPEERGEALRSLGTLCTELTIEDDDAHLGMDEYQPDEEDVAQEFTSRFFPLAEKALRDAIATDNGVIGYVKLAELFISQNKHIDEAKALFEQAQALTTDPKESATIETGKAQLARLQDKPEEALIHYQRAAKLVADMPGVWYNIGELQLSLKQKEAAAKSFLKSIAVDPTTTDAYADLATIYIEQDNDAAAMKILQQGIDEKPFAADLMAAQAMVYISEGDLRKAEERIVEAEEIDPEMEIVFIVRQVIDMQKEQLRQQQQRSSGSKPKKSKKRR